MPKVVTSRLAEREVNLRSDAASHPEADLLTAFLERALPERERSTVLRHLAACAACREIVALAQLAADAAPDAVLVIPRTGASRGLFLRWGALTACAALAVSLVVLHKKQSSEALVAEKQMSGRMYESPTSSDATAEYAKKSVPAVAAEPPQRGKVASQLAITPRRDADAAISTYLKPKRQIVPLTPGPSPMSNNAGFIANNTISNGSAVPNERTLPESEVAGQPTTRTGASAGVLMGDSKLAKTPNADAAKQNEGNREEGKVVQDQVAQDKEAEKDDRGRAEKSRAKKESFDKVAAAQTTQVETVEITGAAIAYAPTEKNELHASSAPLANLAALSAARQAATWQITDAGELQRSFNGGKDWESVTLSQPVKLRVVAATGFHVWAGGRAGLLFHSVDGGGHFTQVTVRDVHSTLIGDIVTLDFPDPQHGRIETASHEVWTTSDSGHTWQRP